jgi:transposase-like protein
MARKKGEVKDAAIAAALASDGSPDALDRIAKDAGVKSRRTVERWISKAKDESESDEDDAPGPVGSSSTSAAPSPPAEAADRRQEGDAEIVLALLRSGVTLTTRSGAMLFGLDLRHPALKDVGSLSSDEEETIRAFAPSLVPALEGLTKYVKKHGALVFGLLLAGMAVPRWMLLLRVAKNAKKTEQLAEKLVAARDAARAERQPVVAPPPPNANGGAHAGDAAAASLRLRPDQIAPGGES